jgi:hypothetical protein
METLRRFSATTCLLLLGLWLGAAPVALALEGADKAPTMRGACGI